MKLRSDALVAHLREKTRRTTHDRSRHVLCPACGVRTKLYALSDGRKKCGVCGTKFHPEKKNDAAKIRQYADLLECFCLDLTAKQAAAMTGYHYRLVSGIYDRFRTLLAAQNLVPGKLALLQMLEACDHGTHESAFCKRCRNRFGCDGRKSGDSPIFGVKMLESGEVFIDPLSESEASARFEPSSGGFSGYAGFICRGKFHRFGQTKREKDGAVRLWAWMSERLKKHHGIWKANAGLYLKELEWKYNHRALPAADLSMAVAELMPGNFLSSWSASDRIELDVGLSATVRSRRPVRKRA